MIYSDPFVVFPYMRTTYPLFSTSPSVHQTFYSKFLLIVSVSNTANQQQSCIQSHDETVQYEYFKPLVFIPLTTPTRGTGIILFLPTYSPIPHGESGKR